MKKSQKTFFWTIFVSLIFAFSTSNIYAADCSNATIKRIGNNPTSSAAASPYMTQLDCASDATWPGVLTLYLSNDLGDSGLATLLTAYSLGKTVWVRTLGTTPGSIISIIYIND